MFGELDQKLGLPAVWKCWLTTTELGTSTCVGEGRRIQKRGLPVCATFPRNVFSIVSLRDTCHFYTKMASFALSSAKPRTRPPPSRINVRWTTARLANLPPEYNKSDLRYTFHVPE